MDNLPLDIDFTKEQDDVSHPEWYDYEYLLVQAKKDNSGIFYRLEDRILLKDAEHLFEFKVKNKSGGDSYTRVIALVKYSSLVGLGARIKSEILESN